jgi:hypothetical protein
MVPVTMGYRDRPMAPGLVAGGRAVEEQQTPTGPEASWEDGPDWWPYALEFPQWHVWRGVSGLVYARRPRTSPPIVVRGEDATDLRDQIRHVETRMV